MEEHKMLPENQHGFRAKRSTMTAWANIQQQWAQNTEKGQITRVMLWDLSAAFDTAKLWVIFNPGRHVLLFGPVINPSYLWELSYHKL